MCSNGHNICQSCKPNLEECPTCRGRLVTMRNKFAEHFSSTIEHPCKYQESGCTSKLSVELKEEHEKNCRYGPHKCPLFIVDLDTCKWVGPSALLEQHFKTEHKDENLNTVTSGKHRNSCPDYEAEINNTCWYQTILTFDNIFFYYCKIINNLLYMCYMFAGAREDNTYKYTISIKTADDEQNVTATLDCPHYHEFTDSKFPNGKCAVFHVDFTKLCLDDKGTLQYEYEIF